MRRRLARVRDAELAPGRALPFRLALKMAAGLVLSAFACPSHAAGFGDYHPAETYAAMSVRSFYIPMRDGVRLAVRLYLPAAGGEAPALGRFPVIWHGSLDIADTGPGSAPLPTGVRFGAEPPAVDPRWENARDLSSLARHGYAVAVVARRGSGASFGRRRICNALGPVESPRVPGAAWLEHRRCAHNCTCHLFSDSVERRAQLAAASRRWSSHVVRPLRAAKATDTFCFSAQRRSVPRRVRQAMVWS